MLYLLQDDCNTTSDFTTETSNVLIIVTMIVCKQIMHIMKQLRESKASRREQQQYNVINSNSNGLQANGQLICGLISPLFRLLKGFEY